MSETVQIIVAAIAAVPLTISSVASVIAAKRTGVKGDLNKKVVKLQKDLHAHRSDSVLHPALTEGYHNARTIL